VVCPVMFISAKKVSALETNELAPVAASIIKLEIHLLQVYKKLHSSKMPAKFVKALCMHG
jgi:hypothetical protein